MFYLFYLLFFNTLLIKYLIISKIPYTENPDTQNGTMDEYQEFHKKVEEEYHKSKKFQDEQTQREEKRKHHEEQWNNQCGKLEDEKQISNIKELYRDIVKKLHPDMNPNASERDLELFYRAAKAYEEGDILTLQATHDEIYNLQNDTVICEDHIEVLTALVEQLMEQIAKTSEEIAGIKEEFPYTEKEFLDNPEAVKVKQDAIIQLIQEYEKEILRLTKLLEEVLQQMADLRGEC